MYTINGQGRPRGEAFAKRPLLRLIQLLAAQEALDFVDIDWQLIESFTFEIGQWQHMIIETVDGDPSLRIFHRCQ
ncbi:hypothetical protein D3C83_148650 [compost metagenome]